MLENIEGLIPITSSLVDGKIRKYFREDTGEDVSERVKILNARPVIINKINIKWTIKGLEKPKDANAIFISETSYACGEEVMAGQYCFLAD
ncbi:hypothetical protein HYT23_04455 [Candidatus Pacearchaeota archaeon]|nr:hypothetical protein [Candidatus Pacearchaeota archaeon]